MKNQIKSNVLGPDMAFVLEHLMTCPEFDQYVLVGGTALALQLGHRKSEDLDLFTKGEYQALLVK
jgi:predicted nucleotidyltransferase component of viral defense system